MSDSYSGNEADFRSAIESLDGVAIWIVSEPGTFEYVSSGAEDIWGIPAEAIQNDATHLVDGIHPDDRERVISIIGQSTQQVSEESYENRVVQPDGTVRWVHTRQIPIREDDGTLHKVVGISTDITA